MYLVSCRGIPHLLVRRVVFVAPLILGKHTINQDKKYDANHSSLIKLLQAYNRFILQRDFPKRTKAFFKLSRVNNFIRYTDGRNRLYPLLFVGIPIFLGGLHQDRLRDPFASLRMTHAVQSIFIFGLA